MKIKALLNFKGDNGARAYFSFQQVETTGALRSVLPTMERGLAVTLPPRRPAHKTATAELRSSVCQGWFPLGGARELRA